MATQQADDATAALLSTLTAAAGSWSKFQLDGRRTALTTAAAATREAKEQSAAARKSLAASTKSLKKSLAAATAATADGEGDATAAAATRAAVAELAKIVKSTVKSYQEEIDSLTRRCKAGDGAAADLLAGLRGLDDPAPLLSAGASNLEAKVGQVHHLLGAMEEMNEEVTRERDGRAQLQDDNDALRRRLEEAERRAEAAERQAEEAFASAASASAAAGSHGAAAADASASSATSSGGGGGSLNAPEREELIQLRREVAEYEVEFRSLKNQDITIRRLEGKIADLEKSSEEQMQARLEEARQELAETEGRRAAEALEREAAAERRVAKVELELRAERAGREATQAHLLEADEGASAREAAWEAQRQILVDDAERLRELLHDATRERDDLRLRVEATAGGHGSSGGGGAEGVGDGDGTAAEVLAERRAFEAEVAEVTLMSSALRDELKIKDEAIAEQRRTMQSTIDKLEADRSSLLDNVGKLQAQVDKAPSEELVENMRRELRILKRLEYNDDGADPDSGADPEMTTPGGVAAGGGADKTLEAVLAGKLKRVEAELVKERREKSELTDACAELRQELDTVEKAKADADALVLSLEADLEKAIQTSTHGSTHGATDSAIMSTPAKDPPLAKSNPATLAAVMEGNEPPPTPLPEFESPAPTVGTSESEKVADDHSVATIVMAQRDRLRARCDALEAERDSFKRELQIQVSSAESLKSDNTKLYEKVRYLQSYSSQSGVGPRSRGAAADRDLDLEALEQRYEASVDPFRQFSRAERQRKLNEMSPPERAVFIFAKVVLGTKEMRTLLFFYMIALHTLVFVTTYHWSHEMGCHDLVHHEDLAHFHGGVPLENQGDAPADAAAAATGDAAAGK
jgi:homeobox protein cut-like